MSGIDSIAIGASVGMTPQEADALAGLGPVRLVTCPNGRVIGGMGSVGLLEHVDESDLQEFINAVIDKRAALGVLAAAPVTDPPRPTYTFVRI